MLAHINETFHAVYGSICEDMIQENRRSGVTLVEQNKNFRDGGGKTLWEMQTVVIWWGCSSDTKEQKVKILQIIQELWTKGDERIGKEKENCKQEDEAKNKK